MKRLANPYYALQLLCLVVFAVLALIYYQLTIDIFIAALLSIIVFPISKKVSEIRIFKRNLGNGVGAIVAILTLLIAIIAIFSVLVPLVYYETSKISQIDISTLTQDLQNSATALDQKLMKYGLEPTREIIASFFGSKSESFMNLSKISSIFEGIINFTGSAFFHIFTILFTTFFLVKDRSTIMDTFVKQIPFNHRIRMREISHKIEDLLSRYFIGLLVEITCMMTLLSLGLWAFDIEGAMFLGCMGGLLNTIPYLGPFIGVIIAIIVNTTNLISTGSYDVILIQTVIIGGVFLAANLIDNIVFQPIIYSKSVKSNPLEIFIVLILAGSIGGILGMILGIPTYTIIKTFYTEVMKYIKEISEERKASGGAIDYERKK